MNDIVEPLVLDLLEWLARRPRTYRETMDGWRTSCPRLPIWEDAVDRGLVERTEKEGTVWAEVTPKGLALLRADGRVPSAQRASAAIN
ncbi:MAG: hypothetical protein O2944_02340 [Proteobacteria bacterium]|nr:hypothetical protein [Pseudomonadota bacterium]